MRPVKQKQKPLRSPKYLKFVRSQKCCICATDQGIEAHHIIGHGTKGMGTKSDDRLTMALCHEHHRELHHDPKAFDHKYRRMSDPAQIYFVNLTLGRARLAKVLDSGQISQARGIISNYVEIEE